MIFHLFFSDHSLGLIVKNKCMIENCKVNNLLKKSKRLTIKFELSKRSLCKILWGFWLGLFVVLETDIGFFYFRGISLQRSLVIVHIEDVSVEGLASDGESLVGLFEENLSDFPLVPFAHHVKLIVVLHEEVELEEEEGENEEKEDLSLVLTEYLSGVNQVSWIKKWVPMLVMIDTTETI